MKKTAALVIFFAWFILPANAQHVIEEIKNFGSNPGNLRMFIRKPHHPVDTITYRAHKPLVVVLHGCNQDAQSISRQSGWNKLADHFDFYAIYPEQKRLNNASDCFNWYSEENITRNKGECGSIKQMIDHMRDSLHIDTTQIFIYGLSAGAAMTSVMMANYPWLFRAGAVLAGGPYGMGTGAMTGLGAMVNSKSKTSKEWGELVEKNNPGYKGSYPNLIVVHGKKDKVVNPKNSIQLIKQFAYLLHTDTVASDTIHSFAKNADVTKYIFRNKENKEKIFYYEIDHLGHALVVDPGDDIMHGGETGLFTVDKDFFSTYWIAKDFGLIR